MGAAAGDAGGEGEWGVLGMGGGGWEGWSGGAPWVRDCLERVRGLLGLGVLLVVAAGIGGRCTRTIFSSGCRADSGADTAWPVWLSGFCCSTQLCYLCVVPRPPGSFLPRLEIKCHHNSASSEN